MFYQYLLESLQKQQLRIILLNIYVFSLINFTKLCSLLATFVDTQEDFQRGLGDMTSRRWKMSNQPWNNVVYVYFNVNINNVRQRQNNAVIFKVEFHNVDQRRNNVVSMTIFKKLKRAKNIFEFQKKRWLIWLTTLTFDGDRLRRKRNMELTM